jgi:hypothetical protein
MFLISKRFRRWLILLVVVPLASWLLARIADRMSEQRGESTVTRALRIPQRWRHRHKAAA